MSVHGSSAPEHLQDRQYVVLLLRLLVDRDGHIVHGDAGGPEHPDSTVERWVHFHGPGALLGAVQGWLASRPDNQGTIAGEDV